MTTQGSSAVVSELLSPLAVPPGETVPGDVLWLPLKPLVPERSGAYVVYMKACTDAGLGVAGPNVTVTPGGRRPSLRSPRHALTHTLIHSQTTKTRIHSQTHSVTEALFTLSLSP